MAGRVVLHDLSIRLIVPLTLASCLFFYTRPCTAMDRVGCKTTDRGQKPCVFPFRYEGEMRTSCIRLNDPAGAPWCSTRVDKDGDHVIGNWGHCPVTCPATDCSTQSQSSRCIFPYRLRGERKYGCLPGTQLEGLIEDDPSGLWCPTKVEVTGEASGDSWARCGQQCPETCRTSEGFEGRCQPPGECSEANIQYLQQNVCPSSSATASDSLTVCCRLQNEDEPTFTRLAPSEQLQPGAELDLAEDTFLESLFNSVEEEILLDEDNAGVGLRFGFNRTGISDDDPEEDDGELEPTDLHVKFNKPLENSNRLHSTASLLQKVAEKILKNDSMSHEADGGISLRSGFNSLTSKTIRKRCPWHPAPKCDPNYPYRSADGSCNNLKNPNYGRTGTPFQRILLPEYAGNSIHLPRKRKDGLELPSPRDISNRMASGLSRLDTSNTVLLMQMGQFIDHDLTHTPAHDTASCCTSRGRFPRSFDGDRCYPIRVNVRDEFWRGSRQCMSFFRSLASPGLNCELQYREQLNQLTHWLDGSNIYGSTELDAKRLREGRGGRLSASQRQQQQHHHSLPSCPVADDSADNGDKSVVDEACDSCEVEQKFCFAAGDLRVNEQPNLIVMHTLFMREHNRVAAELEKVNPTWDDEKLYQEARRITVGEYQHIVYREWLPSVLGHNYANAFRLKPLVSGLSQDYQDDFDPRINNEFAAAAFRFGHSLIPSTLVAVMTNDSLSGRDSSAGSVRQANLALNEVFFKPRMLDDPAMMDGMMRGMMNEVAQAWDANFVDDIRNHLFEVRRGRGGLDLVAINIQRGRDHGLPGYTSYLEICAGKKVTEWSHLTDVLEPDVVARLQDVYQNVDDIDLFVGGFLEQPHEDALVGPVFKCIIGDQFARLKKGDRFFYDLGVDERTAFTPAQLAEVKKASLSRLICLNTDVTRSQPFALKMPLSAVNAVRDCNELMEPPVNWLPFADKA